MGEILEKLKNCQNLADLEILYPSRNISPEAEIVRVAPSPTGFPHIGTAMQSVIDRALANKHPDGRFILRIEDTDRERLVPGAVENIFDTLKWLGTSADEGAHNGGAYGPYTQSERLPIYQLAARHLVSTGHAYRCFCTSARLDELREAQQKAKMMPRYDGKCRDLSKEEADAREAAGEACVVRLKVPPKTKVKFKDEVRGEIEFDTKVLDDHIMLKSDGYPTYHLAVVVDDHFMRVTTVVRGEEWISSTPKHILTYQAFGWQAPKFLHTVLLRNEERKKLSKRDGDTTVNWFRAQGYLPEGFRNFLTRIMWAHPDNKDIYPLEEFSKLMTPDHLPATGPVVDMKLLGFINGKYIGSQPPAQLRETLCAYLQYLLDTKQVPDVEEGQAPVEISAIETLLKTINANTAYAEQVLGLEPERHQKLADLLLNCAYFFDATYVPASAEMLNRIYLGKGAAAEANNSAPVPEIEGIVKAIETAYSPTMDHDAWDVTMRAIAAEKGVKDKVVFMLARAVITGQERTPPLFEIMELLGEERVRARLASALNPQPSPA